MPLFKIIRLLILFLYYSNQGWSQTVREWDLKTTGIYGWQIQASPYALAVKAKYTTGGNRAALFTEVYTNPGFHFTINQMPTSEYNKIRSAYIGVVFQKDPAASRNSIYLWGSTSNYAKDFETDANDEYIIIGDNKGNGWNPVSPVSSIATDSSQILLFKVAPDKTVRWYKTYGGSSAEYAINIQKTADGNYMVLGQTQSNDGDISGYKGGKDIWLLKISNTDGSIIWKKTIGTSANEIPTDMEILPDGSIVISGAAEPSILFPSSYAGLNSFLLKLDAAGNITWTKVLGGNGADEIHAFVPSADGGFVTISNSTSFDGDYSWNNGGSDVYVMRHNSTGNIIWSMNYGDGNNNMAGDIAVSSCDSSIFASWSREWGGPVQPVSIYPAWSQAGSCRTRIKNDGTLIYWEDNLKYQGRCTGSNEYFNKFLTPSIMADKRGGILVVEIWNAKMQNNNLPGSCEVGRSFVFTEYGIPLRIKKIDTILCRGQQAGGYTFDRDSSFSDTLRNNCNIDTLITDYKVRILNKDSVINKDTVLCYGALYNGLPYYASLTQKDTAAVTTSCGTRFIITNHNITVVPAINADSVINKDTVLCYGAFYNGFPLYTSLTKKDTVTISTSCGSRLIITNNNITVAPLIPRLFPNDTLLCKNQSLPLTAFAPAANYVWQNGSSLPNFTASSAGLYWVEVTDTLGCRSRDSILITVSDLYLNVPSQVTIQLPQTATLTAQSNGTVLWNNHSTLTCTLCNTNIANPQVTTTYILSASKDNCRVTASLNVIVNKENVNTKPYFYIPNAFSPNGDYANDVFRVYTNITGPFNMELYNRFGETVFTSTDPQKGWDGKYKGIMQPIGMYVYMISYYTNNSQKITEKGTFLLIR